MEITIDEARSLYKQGGCAKEIALRKYSEGEILNDYTLIITLPDKVVQDKLSYLRSQLYQVYKEMSKGRPLKLTKDSSYYLPEIIISYENYQPGYGTYAGKVKIDVNIYSIYLDTIRTICDGRLDFENNGVYCGRGLFRNKWAFKEKAQAEHFVKNFYRELIESELGDFYKIEFIDI